MLNPALNTLVYVWLVAGEGIFRVGGGGRGGALHLAAAGQEGARPRSAPETSDSHCTLPRQILHRLVNLFYQKRKQKPVKYL